MSHHSDFCVNSFWKILQSNELNEDFSKIIRQKDYFTGVKINLNSFLIFAKKKKWSDIEKPSDYFFLVFNKNFFGKFLVGNFNFLLGCGGREGHC